MPRAQSIVSTVVLFGLLVIGTEAQSQTDAHEDLTSCSGSAAEPAQSAPWAVVFCNRTAHDLVVEFHDNDCPAKDWARRGDVYRKDIRRGESMTVSLCYANESHKTASPARGVPTLRIPGGKGVVTTWNVVGDCGDRSDRLNLDARTFYDRGDYKTGIVLLQYPSGAAHCVASASSSVSSASAQPSAQALPPAQPSASVQPFAGARTAVDARSSLDSRAPVSAAPGMPAPVTPARSDTPPSLSAVIDANDSVGRAVQVFATGGLGYACNFTLALTFSDGGTWNDRARTDITNTDPNAPISTRKYLKSVSKVTLASSKCAHH